MTAAILICVVSTLVRNTVIDLARVLDGRKERRERQEREWKAQGYWLIRDKRGRARIDTTRARRTSP